jgi:hypothetical protein
MLTEINEGDMVAVLCRTGRGDWQFVTYAVSKELGWRMSAAVRASEGRGCRTAVVARKDFEEGRVRDIKPPSGFDPDAREAGQWILRCESSKTNDVWLLKDARTFAYADEPKDAHKFSSVDEAKEVLARIRSTGDSVNWRWAIVEWDDELGLAPTAHATSQSEGGEPTIQSQEGFDDDLDF